MNAAAPKAAAIRHDPQASRVERLRVEEAALMANAKTESPAMAELAHLPVHDASRYAAGG